MSETPCFIKLPMRGLIEIEGPDRYDFLQRLITQDIKKLESQPVIYGCLLTPQGKFLHDFFISEGPDVLLLDCEGLERAEDLYERLDKYKMRADVRVSVEPRSPVFICYGIAPRPGYMDPRHESLGWRSFTKPEDDGIEEKPFAFWDAQRIKLGIADGSRDALVEKSTVAELNIDQHHGVSFEKGCYVGQELTARMKHRGLAKKHLYPVTGELPIPATQIERDGKVIGLMRSQCNDNNIENEAKGERLGLALLKDDDKDLFETEQTKLYSSLPG